MYLNIGPILARNKKCGGLRRERAHREGEYSYLIAKRASALLKLASADT